jgi:hypothetical protein
MLSAYTYRNQTYWDIDLPVIVHTYNIAINAITGYSPFFAVHRREARRPTDQWMEDYLQRIERRTRRNISNNITSVTPDQCTSSSQVTYSSSVQFRNVTS